MPFIKAEYLPGEPIAVTTFEGHVAPMDIIKVSATNADYLDKHGGVLYSIADLRRITTSFPDMLKIINNDNQGRPGSSTDPRLRLMLVGTSEFVKLFVNAMEQFGGVQIPVFTDLDEAIEAARTAIRQNH
jgi:hypothetical protein